LKVAAHTGGVASKYDSYWVDRLASIRTALARAVDGQSAGIELPNLIRLGERQSWYGTAEVRGSEVVSSSMAHATSLGRTITASGVCESWPGITFRFAITAAGDRLTISRASDLTDPAASATVGQKSAGATHARASGPSDGGSAAARAQIEAGEGVRTDDAATKRFYLALRELEEALGGTRLLRESNGANGWPRYGVYFFYEPGEVRTDGSHRVVRVGTHALTATSQTTLWGRLRQHRGRLAGRRPGGGNHRASVFRRHVGAALIRREKLSDELLASWLDRHGPRPGYEVQEEEMEQEVSHRIGAMPFLWLGVTDRVERGSVERNSIALTSRMAQGLDLPSADWLGQHADSAAIRQSALWNIEHVRHEYEVGFLDALDRLIERQRSS
jgi:hypothetical protein